MTAYYCTLMYRGERIASACPADSMAGAILYAMSLESTLIDAVPSAFPLGLTIKVHIF